MFTTTYTPAEIDEATRTLSAVGVRSGFGDVASLAVMLGFLINVIRFALLGHPDDPQLRAAGAAIAAFKAFPRTPATPPARPRGTEPLCGPGEETQRITAPLRSLATAQAPDCQVDGTGWCRTHQGLHVVTAAPTPVLLERLLVGLRAMA